MRVVLDTSVLVSALVTPEGATSLIYQAWRLGRFTLITSEEQMDEFRRVTRYPRLKKYISPLLAGAMFNEIRLLGELVVDLPRVKISKDPGDNFVLAMVLKGKADYLVTGDKKDLLALRKFKGTAIVTARKMVEILSN